MSDYRWTFYRITNEVFDRLYLKIYPPETRQKYVDGETLRGKVTFFYTNHVKIFTNDGKEAGKCNLSSWVGILDSEEDMGARLDFLKMKADIMERGDDYFIVKTI